MEPGILALIIVLAVIAGLLILWCVYKISTPEGMPW
jgi:hypothetical protein